MTRSRLRDDDERRMKQLAVAFLVVATLFVLAIAAFGMMRLVEARIW
jgi:hypothetical protein